MAITRPPVPLSVPQTADNGAGFDPLSEEVPKFVGWSSKLGHFFGGRTTTKRKDHR